MASRKTQEKLARGSKRIDEAGIPAEEAPGEAEAQAAFEKMMKDAQESARKAQAEQLARYERQVASADRFTAAIEKLAEALEHVAVRIAFDHGVKQAERATGGSSAPERKPVRAERADPEPSKPEPKPEPKGEVSAQETVRDAVRAAVKAGNGGKAVEVLAKFKAEAVSDLKPADYAAVLVALKPLAG